MIASMCEYEMIILRVHIKLPPKSHDHLKNSPGIHIILRTKNCKTGKTLGTTAVYNNKKGLSPAHSAIHYYVREKTYF